VSALKNYTGGFEMQCRTVLHLIKF